MVKADPSHDYYADLELPSTADSEAIRKQFRLLAKQYHPDRNPGREIEMIPKFQAIQAANEILGDATQKKNYDRDRAKVNQPPAQPPTPSRHATDTYTFKKPAKPPPPPSDFPPPPKRDPNLNRPFGTSRTRPHSSASAEKFAQFAKAAPQTWDRQKYEDAARAETLRNLNNMRGQSQGPPPRVPPRAAPTAPKPPSTAPSPDIPHASGPSPGFPGLSRTNSTRRGFAPGTPGTDEPPAPSSAYAHVHRSDRPPPASNGYSYPPNFAKEGMSTSPPMPRARPSMSPLRTTKSSGFEDVQRPGLQRTSSRYHVNPGEKTDINGPGLTRSTSVRNSPTGHRWDESGPFGGRPQSQQPAGFKAPPLRHHSSSPRGRAEKANFQFSASETSSSEDEPQLAQNRPKAMPRKTQQPNAHGHQPFSDNDPALTGQFSSNNYNTKVNAEKQYYYPPPTSNGTPSQSQWSAPSNPIDDITQGLNQSGIRHVHRDDVPNKNQSSQRANGTSSEPQSANPNSNNTFSAAEWDGKFAPNGDNVFRPTESASRSRSPTKQPRSKVPNRNRGGQQGEREEDSGTNDETNPQMPGVRHVPGVGETPAKGAAFQAGKFSAEDWAERLRSQKKKDVPKGQSRDSPVPTNASTKQPSNPPEVVVGEYPTTPNQQVHPQTTNAGPDAMDIDETTPHQATPVVSPGGTTTAPNASSRRPSTGGVTLNDLKETAPFKPSATGLSDLGDLNNNLPFESRAAEELNLRQPPSQGPAARQLKLPTPPKPIPAPDEARLTQEVWSEYSEKMILYMDAWNIFNCKMIDHFRTRQEQISLAMYHNWVTAVGDGASADDFDGLDFVGSESSRQDQSNHGEGGRPKPKKAGYATYMQWLKQDRVCRTWWEVAFDEHTKCMEDLGKVRKLVKSIRAKEFGK